MRLTENRISFGSDDIFGRPQFIKFVKIGASLVVFAIVLRTTIRLLFLRHLHQQLRQLLRPLLDRRELLLLQGCLKGLYFYVFIRHAFIVSK